MRTTEYTTPLAGKPYYQSTGLIRVFDRRNRLFNVGEINYERFDDQNFQYIFKPYWNSIDVLPDGLFQGIPGINMDMRQDVYYRVNMTPTFITMRTPSEAREDVNELMASVNLDYYDRFEWLLRSEMRCGDDNIVVIRKPINTHNIITLDKLGDFILLPENEIEIYDITSFVSSKAKLIEDLYQVMQSGCKVFLKNEKRYVEEFERRTMAYLLLAMMSKQDEFNRASIDTGIANAKSHKKYRGRKPIEINENLLKKVAKDFKQHKISEKEAMDKLELKSRSTFYRKIKGF